MRAHPAGARRYTNRNSERTTGSERSPRRASPPHGGAARAVPGTMAGAASGGRPAAGAEAEAEAAEEAPDELSGSDDDDDDDLIALDHIIGACTRPECSAHGAAYFGLSPSAVPAADGAACSGGGAAGGGRAFRTETI